MIVEAANKFFFSDEAGALFYGPFATEEAAKEGQAVYSDVLNGVRANSEFRNLGASAFHYEELKKMNGDVFLLLSLLSSDKSFLKVCVRIPGDKYSEDMLHYFREGNVLSHILVFLPKRFEDCIILEVQQIDGIFGVP